MARKAYHPPENSTNTLAQSTLHIRLQALEKEHRRLLQQIKKKRTELNNFMEQTRSVASEMFHKSTPSFQQILTIDEEIHQLFNELLTNSKFKKQTKQKIQEVYLQLQFAGILSPKRQEKFEESFKEDSDHKVPPPHEDNYYYRQESQSEIESNSANRSDSRKIRSLFLQLAEIFHPDKVQDSETQVRYTEIMKEINKAYQEGDLARLLEIEQRYQVGETIDSNNEGDLERTCTRLEQQNELLKTQYESLKAELRSFKKTPEGSIVSDFRKVKKQGFDPIAQMLEQVESQVQIISGIRDFVRDFQQQKISVKEFLGGPPILRSISEDIMDSFLEQMFGG
jgi:predicted RNase H-like nuclease (RuvC/YqgF family)